MIRRVYIETFGCQMNDVDSARMLALLGTADYRPTESLSDADLVLLNTCSIREKADQKIYSALGTLRRWKRDREGRLVAVGGCLAQQEGASLRKRAPHVDIVFGTHSIARLPDLVRLAQEKGAPVSTELSEDTSHWDVLPYLANGSTGAMVTIMQGCDNYCAYCIVPYVRGREISRPSAEILDEVRELAERGVREVVLLGQNVNSFGKKAGEIAFPELLRRVAKIGGISRIRFITSHPRDLDRETIGLFSEIDSLCPHIHLPIQAGSERILLFHGTRIHTKGIPRKDRRPSEGEARDRVLLGFHRWFSGGDGDRFPGDAVGHGGGPIRFVFLFPVFPPSGDPCGRDDGHRGPGGGKRAAVAPPCPSGPPHAGTARRLRR